MARAIYSADMFKGRGCLSQVYASPARRRLAVTYLMRAPQDASSNRSVVSGTDECDEREGKPGIGRKRRTSNSKFL